MARAETKKDSSFVIVKISESVTNWTPYVSASDAIQGTELDFGDDSLWYYPEDRRSPDQIFDDKHLVHALMSAATNSGINPLITFKAERGIQVYDSIAFKAGFHGSSRNGVMAVNGVDMLELEAWDRTPQEFVINVKDIPGFTGTLESISIRQKELEAQSQVGAPALADIFIDGNQLLNDQKATVIEFEPGADLDKIKVGSVLEQLTPQHVWGRVSAVLPEENKVILDEIHEGFAPGSDIHVIESEYETKADPAIQDTDWLIVNRGGTDYKILALALKEALLVEPKEYEVIQLSNALIAGTKAEIGDTLQGTTVNYELREIVTADIVADPVYEYRWQQKKEDGSRDDTGWTVYDGNANSVTLTAADPYVEWVLECRFTYKGATVPTESDPVTKQEYEVVRLSDALIFGTEAEIGDVLYGTTARYKLQEIVRAGIVADPVYEHRWQQKKEDGSRDDTGWTVYDGNAWSVTLTTADPYVEWVLECRYTYKGATVPTESDPVTKAKPKLPWDEHDGVVWHILNKDERINFSSSKGSQHAVYYPCYDIDGNSLGTQSRIERNQEVIVLTAKSCAYLFQDNDDADWAFGHLQDTSLAEDFLLTFKNCKKFTGDVSNWDVGNVWRTKGMFLNCEMWNSDLSNWKLTVRDVAEMFRGCKKFDSKGLNNWDVSQAQSFEWMFAYSKFDDTLESWDVRNAKTFRYMFYEAEVFKGIGLDKWNVSNRCTKLSYMFNYAEGLTSIDLRGWDTSEVLEMTSTFTGTKSFNGNVSTWKTGECTDMEALFCASVFNGDISQWDTGRVTNMQILAKNNKNFNCDISKWNTRKVVKFNGAFENCDSFNRDLGGWDTSSVTNPQWNAANLQNMFKNCVKFNQDLSGWCVKEFPILPANFDTGCTAWTKPRPIWGSCP
jgi:surface protein